MLEYKQKGEMSVRIVKEPDVRKQEILEGALRVFAQKGYDRATISTIAKELNISQGLCYRYFPSKEDIYTAAIERYADLILETYQDQIREEKHICQWVDEIGERITRLTAAETKDQQLYDFFHGANCRRLHDELMLKVAARRLPQIRQVLRNAKAKGEIHVDDPDTVAVMGLYGEVGVLLTAGDATGKRAETIRQSWLRLLGLLP